MKYVMLQPISGGLAYPIFCLPPVTHAQLVAPYAGTALPVSAGFIEFLEVRSDGSAKVRAFGRSSSLNLEPRRHDSALIESFYNAARKMEQPSAKTVALTP